ncbi:MAG: CHAD domain-containing protein [Candidatus Angelobacter sp.]
MKGLTEDLSGVVSKVSSEATPKSVHRLRTTVRRIESLVSYAHPDLGKKLERTLERLAELRRRAGKVRDIDVEVELLDQVGNGSTAKDRKVLSGILKKKRDRHAKRLVSALGKFADSKLFSRMERIAEKAATGPSDSNRPLAPLEEAGSQLVRMADDFSQRSLKPNRLHQARIQVKMIRYLAELADETPEQQRFIEGLKAAQGAIGAWHDWEELAKLAEKKFADRANCALLSEIRALFAARRSAAISALTDLFASAVAPPARKPPRAAQSARTVAQRA